MVTRWRGVRWVAAWALGVYFARMYLAMGWVKFDSNGFWTAAFARWGYPPWFRVAIGALEVVGGAALVIPWIASYGAIVLVLVMLGAWGTRAHDGRWVDVAWITAYAIGLAWIAFEWWGLRLFRRGAKAAGTSTS
ncbi:MAG: DoxX family protein [Gemmatimonadota bacterium]